MKKRDEKYSGASEGERMTKKGSSECGPCIWIVFGILNDKYRLVFQFRVTRSTLNGFFFSRSVEFRVTAKTVTVASLGMP